MSDFGIMTPRINHIPKPAVYPSKTMGTTSVDTVEKAAVLSWKDNIHQFIISMNILIQNSNQLLTRFWRRYGVKLGFVYSFFIIWYGVNTMVVDNNPNSKTEYFSKLQTFWMSAWRISALFIINFTLPGLISLMLYTAPDEWKNEQNEKLKKRDPIRLILRIVTRGDYPKLIRDLIAYHENLFSNYWSQDDDEIEIHLLSETPLNMSRPKRNGTVHRCEVKEFDIPPTYTTPNKTLYKARNNTYALERCLELAKSRDERLDKIWLIAIDEDVFLTKYWLREFDDTVLNSKIPGEYKFVHSTARPIFLDSNMGVDNSSWIPPIVPFFGEAFRFAMDVSRVWWQAKLFGRSAVGLRGACYAIRLDVEARIGYDLGGPFLSIGDDTTFFHRLSIDADVKLKFLDAWFLEGTPNTALSFMKQRARWVRNYLYCLIFSNIPAIRKIRLASFLICWTIVLPMGMLVWITGGLLLMANGHFIDFFPAGPSWPVIDTICCVSAACVIYWYTYGCALLLPWYWAVLIWLTFSTYIPVAPLHFLGAMAAVWGLIGALHELATGVAEFGFTEKKVD